MKVYSVIRTKTIQCNQLHTTKHGVGKIMFYLHLKMDFFAIRIIFLI